MFGVLVVDDDATSLKIAEACLKRCNYKVMAVTHAFKALSLLGEQKDEEELSYDLVLADVHMPDMDGFELLQYVKNNFNIPVILISSDDKTEVICKGLNNGAPTYLLKPLKTDDVKYLWQYSILWKNREKSACKRFNEVGVPRKNSSSPSTDIEGGSTERKIKKPTWPANLHNRFVEAILILGVGNAVPRKILEVMNVPILDREQVASHLQKFRKFMERILDGETSLDETSKYWIDSNYYSRIVGGNPNVILLNQLREKRRTGKIADPIPAFLPLPPFNEVDASSSMSNDAVLMSNNHTYSTVNVTTETLNLGDVTFQSAPNVATSSHHTAVSQLNYHTFQSVVNGGSIGGTSMFPSTNHIVSSGSTISIRNQFISQKPFNVGLEGKNIQFGERNFNNADLQMENVQLNGPDIGSSYGTNTFGISSGMNIEQMVQPDPNSWNSFDAYQLGNTNQQITQLDPNLRDSFDAYQFGNTNQQLASVEFGGDANEVRDISTVPINQQICSRIWGLCTNA